METPSLEGLIVNKIFTDDSFMRKVVPFLQLEYFKSPYKEIFKVFVDHVNEFNNIPKKEAFCISLESSRVQLSLDNPETRALVYDLFTDKEIDNEWMLKKTEAWCQEKALHNAIMKSIQIIDGKIAELKKEAIPDVLQTALSVSFDTHIGHDYIDNAAERYDFYHMVEERIPFDLDMMNIITNGGLTKKSLSVILASTGVGKSAFMCHMAASVLSQSMNVLYITLEMAEERIAERIDANLFDIPVDQIENLSREVYMNKVNSISSKTHGKLIIKEYPTSQAHSGHFRALFRELKMKKKFEPDMVFIDYINICCSSRVKMGGSVNSYTYIKNIAEELRGLTMEFNLPIVTATQINREGSRSSDPDIEDTSESWGLPATCDLMFALVSSDELEENSQIMVKQLKNRYNDLNKHKRFVLGIERPKMKFFDVPKSEQTLINPNQKNESSIEVAMPNIDKLSELIV